MNDLQKALRELDDSLFGGLLQDGTSVDWLPALTEEGSCKTDGSHIFIKPGLSDWRSTLVHEMVHAFEFRFPGMIKTTPEGQAAAAKFVPMRFAYGPHSAAFFSKLFEVMRQIGDDPSGAFSRYFG